MAHLKLIVIASTPRSGSSMFGNLLQANGLGLPNEYFNRGSTLPELMKKNNLQTIGDYWEYLKEYCSRGGYLTIKAHFDQFAFFATNVDLWGDPCVDSPRFIALSRQNRRAQAISYFIAKEGGYWNSSNDWEETKQKLLSHGLAEIGWKLRTYMVNIELREAMWREYCNHIAAPSLSITYEELLQSPEKVAQKVQNFLELPECPVFDLASSGTKNPSDELKATLLRCLDDMSPQMASNMAIYNACMEWTHRFFS